jgi:GNAT superfamily N-acetyltransferase
LLDNVQATEARLRHSLLDLHVLPKQSLATKRGACRVRSLLFQLVCLQGLPGLYLEDIFVRPAFLRAGIDRQLFAFLANKAQEAGCSPLSCRSSNGTKKLFASTDTLGAEPIKGWFVFRVRSDALEKFGFLVP